MTRLHARAFFAFASVLLLLHPLAGVKTLRHVKDDDTIMMKEAAMILKSFRQIEEPPSGLEGHNTLVLDDEDDQAVVFNREPHHPTHDDPIRDEYLEKASLLVPSYAKAAAENDASGVIKAMDADARLSPTALHIAARKGFPAMAQMLPKIQDWIILNKDKKIEYINRQDQFNNTALHVAAQCRENVILQFLLDAGADTEIRNMFDETPLFFAVATNTDKDAMSLKPQMDTLKLLLKSGSRVDALNLLGQSPLDITENKNILEFVEQTLDHDDDDAQPLKIRRVSLDLI